MKICIVIAIGVFLLIFLGTSIDGYNQSFLAKHGISKLQNDIFYKTFGEFKDYLSDMSYVRADVYYHGGVYKFDEDEAPHGKCLHMEEGGDEDAHIHKNGHMTHEVKPSLNILLDISKAKSITKHRHLRGKEEKEIVPWLYYSVRLNPHNEMAYAIGGFWLAIKLKHPDEAIKFLKEGIMNNPDSWKIRETLGQIYLLNKKDYKAARIYLEKAEELADKQNVDKFEKRKIYTFLAEAYVRLGYKDKARKLYKKLLSLFPGSKTIEHKIRENL